jgi:DNA-binding NarL/FixJ family response regulator
MGDNNFLTNSVQTYVDHQEPPDITLINDQKWTQIGKRYNMTPRELEVAKLACRGLDNKQIGRTLNIKDGTVKTHIRNIYRRLNVQSRIAMFLKFIRFAAQISEDDERRATILPAIVEHSIKKENTSPSEVLK